MEAIKEVVMQGKERDMKLAQVLRQEFIDQYNEKGNFRTVIENLGPNLSDRLIHRLKTEEKIDFYKDYVALKGIAEKVIENMEREIFLSVCSEDNARAWINDNGKYKDLVFEGLYRVFKKQEDLKQYIQQ